MHQLKYRPVDVTLATQWQHEIQRARSRLSAHMHHICTIIGALSFGDRLGRFSHNRHKRESGNKRCSTMCLQHYCTFEVRVHMSYRLTCLIILHRGHLTTMNRKLLIPFHRPRPIHLPDPQEEPENTQSCLTRHKAKQFKATQAKQTQQRVESNRRPLFGTQTRSQKQTPQPRPKERPLSVTTWRLLS